MKHLIDNSTKYPELRNVPLQEIFLHFDESASLTNRFFRDVFNLGNACDIEWRGVDLGSEQTWTGLYDSTLKIIKDARGNLQSLRITGALDQKGDVPVMITLPVSPYTMKDHVRVSLELDGIDVDRSKKNIRRRARKLKTVTEGVVPQGTV